jgi:endonuclease/exonuclease/phosphatase family metal-dependent hydrolase
MITLGCENNHMKRFCFLFSCFLLGWPVASSQQSSFAGQWEFRGISVEEPGYTIWGTSPIIGDDGKVHLFVARWPCELKVDPGWRSHSEIAHYIGEGPEGPFAFSDVAFSGTGEYTWDRYSAHNPAIHKVGDRFVLLYVSNTNPRQPPHPANQCIGMAVSSSLCGPWKRVGTDGLILAPPDDEKYWNYRAGNGVNNPAFLQHPDGGFFLYFKSEVSGWIRQQEPDIVALQELCKYTADKLEEDAGAWGHSHSVLLKTTGYSVGITSRYPIKVKEKLMDRMHHGALHCVVRGIDVFVIHFSPHEITLRRKEAAIILDKLSRVRDRNHSYLVMGERGSFPGRILGALNNESDEELVSRLERIDFILASPNLSVKCTGTRVCNGPENYYLSDHYPVIAEFDLSEK